jgi:hypothetical protein
VSGRTPVLPGRHYVIKMGVGCPNLNKPVLSYKESQKGTSLS